MRFVLILFILITFSACNTSRVVYWCGDHPCINKKEKESYFKETMIVETKLISKEKKGKNKSQMQKIIEQAKIKQKERITQEKDLTKQAKLEQKEKLKKEKQLLKQARSKEKQRLKEEKELAKQVKLEEKQRLKAEKKLAKKIKKDKKNKNVAKITQNIKKLEKINTQSNTSKLGSNKFQELVEKIAKENIFKPYPNINDIPK